jgi:hypothetical protein
MSLAHSVGSEIERSYRRGELIEKRPQLMTQWSKFVCTPARKKAVGDNVVALVGDR